METISRTNFNNNKINYNKLNLVKTYKNGSEDYSYECTCHRCQGKGVIVSYIENGKEVLVRPDSGTCWNCLGSGVETRKIHVISDEQFKSSEQEKINKANERRLQFEQQVEQRRRETIAKHLEEGYKEVDFSIASWFDYKITSKYYKIAKETEKAICIDFMDKLEDGVFFESWFPKKAIIWNN